MSDQWRGEKLPAGMGYQGASVRERPLLDHEGVGPWKGHVSVTYVQGAGFEVAARWEGPPLEVAGRPDGHHLAAAGDELAAAVERATPTLANDVVYVADEQLARAVAGAAESLLRAPKRPNLPSIAADLKRRGS